MSPAPASEPAHFPRGAARQYLTTVQRRFLKLQAFALLGVMLAPVPTPATTLPTGFRDSLVVGGFNFPVGMTRLPDGRVLVIEQASAKIRLIAAGALSTPDPVGTIGQVNALPVGSERGLLGIAVDPAWPAQPYIYVQCDATVPANKIRISRYTATGVLTWNGVGSSSITIDPASRRDLIDTLPDDSENHNGGTLRFGPDGMLYASIGEDEQACMAQDDSTLHGVILRLDVTRLPGTPGGVPALSVITPPDNPQVGSPNLLRRLIWAWGLRNPFRFTIDPATGVLYICDVGQSTYEEVDRAPVGGLDMGWPIREGPAAYSGSCSSPNSLTGPIYSYNRTSFANGAAIICGAVYRVATPAAWQFPAGYDGDVFFSDYYEGFLRRLHFDGTNWALASAVPGQPNASDWGRGMQGVSDYMMVPDGSLWYCLQQVNNVAGTGAIRRIAPASGTVGVGGGPGAVLAIALEPPFPQPASESVSLRYTLGTSQRVDLTIFDVRGRRIRDLISGVAQSAGASSVVRWDGLDDAGHRAPAGLYLARLSAGGVERSQPVLLLR